jgi:ubiquinone/menaquinone biosynthesis C-methylase UbiE
MTSHRERILDQFSRQAVPFSNAAAIRDERALQLIVDAARAGADDTVLDVACGPGLVACAFAATTRQVIGIDLTAAMIARAGALAEERALTNLRFLIGDVAPLPIADATFSVVVSRFAMHHFEQPAGVVAEMRRVCRPGGRVVIADLLAAPDPDKAQAFHRLEMLRDPSHVRALTLDELRTLYRDAGFGAPAETFWKMHIDVDDLMSRSFPAPGSEATIRQLYEDSVKDDGLGLATRREAGRLRFSYSNVVLSAVR